MQLARKILLGVASLLWVATPAAASEAAASDPAVVPIAWRRFDRHGTEDADLRQSRQILAHATRYNLALVATEFHRDDRRGLYVINQFGEHTVRPAASVCFGTAVALKCAKLTRAELGVSPSRALRRTVRLIRGVAAAYQANGTDGKGWGGQWQSAYWATFVGQAAWMLWDQLDAETRTWVRTLVVKEADRFIAPGYAVPYWTAPDGHVNTPGDTKAEENAWNADILQLAVAMMPRHPRVPQWKRVGSELMVSAYSREQDLRNDRLVDGRPVQAWLHGFNVFPDGSVVNHNIINPIYMMCVVLNARTYLTQSLAHQPVPEAAEWNVPFVYQALATHAWPSPPYAPPGGTIYTPGRAEIYSPQGADWSKVKFDQYYVTQGEFMKDGHPGMSESVLAVVQQLSASESCGAGFLNALVAGWAGRGVVLCRPEHGAGITRR